MALAVEQGRAAEAEEEKKRKLLEFDASKAKDQADRLKKLMKRDT